MADPGGCDDGRNLFAGKLGTETPELLEGLNGCGQRRRDRRAGLVQRLFDQICRPHGGQLERLLAELGSRPATRIVADHSGELALELEMDEVGPFWEE